MLNFADKKVEKITIDHVVYLISLLDRLIPLLTMIMRWRYGRLLQKNDIPLSFEAIHDTFEDVPAARPPAVYIVWLAVVACDIGI